MPISGSRSPSRLAIDTSAYVHFVRGDTRVRDLIEASETTLVPVIVLGELEAGFRAGRRYDANLAGLETFLGFEYVRVLPVTHDAARIYGSLYGELRKTGGTMSSNDLWIAAAAIEAGAHLVTFDADFDRIPMLDRTVLTAS
jgi:predicted nucleic acid-binding protein